MQLIEKDKKIKELTKMVQMYESGKKKIEEVMVINSSPTGKLNKDLEEEDYVKKYDAEIFKMSRADFLMS
jgi:hypothetical protein